MKPDDPVPDPFDHVEEYVGVDDEGLYRDVMGTENHAEPSYVGEKWYEPVEDEDPEELTVTHDLKNPTIVKGALFFNIVDFRKAIRHYAILRDFEIRTIKSDKNRFIGECKHMSCFGRIHASKMQDGCAIAVKTLNARHTCPSTKMREGKMAS